jgi:hypothetical protein
MTRRRRRRPGDEEDARLNAAAFGERPPQQEGHFYFYWCFHKPGRWCAKVCPECDARITLAHRHAVRRGSSLPLVPMETFESFVEYVKQRRDALRRRQS